MEERIKNYLLSKFGKDLNVELVTIPSGVFVSVINNDKTLSRKIMTELVAFHQSLPEGEDAFPFKVYVYGDEKEAFKQKAYLKVKEYDYDRNISFLSVGDEIIKMKEIDVDSILYGAVPHKFNFLPTDKNKLKVFKYVQIDLSGKRFKIRPESFAELRDGCWSVTIDGFED